MYERRWGVIAGSVVAVILVGAIGWAIGRSTAADSAEADGARQAKVEAIRFVDGTPVGTRHTRAGALTAADNYVTTATETVLQDPARFEALVRRVYAPEYQARALREAREAREGAPDLVADYKAGRTGVAIVAARRLDSYTDDEAEVTTWRAGVVWGGSTDPFTQWFLTETRLKWDVDGGRWLVAKTDDVQRVAPAPPIRYQDRQALRNETFTRELRDMTAPIYGASK
jgi:hypothetical protein